jgi:hypothetical protein
MSTYRIHKRLAKLSSIDPIRIDCCVNVCHAFTGDYAEEAVCSTCEEPCFDSNGKPCQVFEYLPAMPRFQGYYNNPRMIEAMRYCHNHQREPGRIENHLDSTGYSELCDTDIIVDGVNLGIKFLSRRRDIAYLVMLDSVKLFEQAAGQKSTCWPIMAQNLNLPASERVKLRNIIPLGVIPGLNQPKDFDSFLVPFVEEALDQAHGARLTMSPLTPSLRFAPIPSLFWEICRRSSMSLK